MDEILEQALLYDFYGELLNEHQKQIYEALVYNDMSLSEIADEQGISRQGVHDLIKRCNKALIGYEEKLHLFEKFVYIKEKVGEIQKLIRSDHADRSEAVRLEIEKISNEIIEGL